MVLVRFEKVSNQCRGSSTDQVMDRSRNAIVCIGSISGGPLKLGQAALYLWNRFKGLGMANGNG